MIPADLFDGLPSEVRNLWLEPIAARDGWPFKSLDDSTENTLWHSYFMRMSLQEINELRWSLETVDIASQSFRLAYRDLLEDIIQNHVMGRHPVWPRSVRSKERFWSCVDFIRVNGTLPEPVILREVNGMMDIFDGCHRLSALSFLVRVKGMAVDLKVQAWVARHAKEIDGE